MKTAHLHPYTVSGIRLSSTIPWNIVRTNAPSFWKHVKGISPVVAVIDTGIDPAHPEFDGRIYKPQVFCGGIMSDEEGHGTHVAGTIAGKTQGMAPGARIMPLKIKFGVAETVKQINDAFFYCYDHMLTCADEDKIVAINCSFDGPHSPMMAYFIRELQAMGVAIVVAAGNKGDGDHLTDEAFSYPGHLYEVITSAALDSNGKVAGFSSSYEGVDLAAPGVEVPSAWPGGTYKALSGTSMSTPHVTGAVANIQGAFYTKHSRWATSDELERILFTGCIEPSDINHKLVGRGTLFLPASIKKVDVRFTDQEPFITPAGRMVIPVRIISEGLGDTVDWSPDNPDRVAVSRPGKTVELFNGRRDYYLHTSLF